MGFNEQAREDLSGSGVARPRLPRPRAAGPSNGHWPGEPAHRTPAPIVQEGIVLLDEQMRILSLNPAAQKILGCSRHVLAGMRFDSILGAAPPGASLEQASSSAGLDLDAASATPQCESGCRGRRADGSDFPIDFEVAPLGGGQDAGPRARFAAFIRDLSNQATLQTELHIAERRLRTLVELAPIAIWVTEGDVVIFANRAAGNLIGVGSGAAMVGKSIYALFSEENHAELRRQLAHALSHEGVLGSLQARLAHHSETCEVEIALAALPDHGRTTVQMVVSDVSQRNRVLREIERSRQLAKRLSANVVEAREEERRRIARELHDELGQSLSALKMDIAEGAPSTQLLPRLDGIMQSVRRIAADLRPLMLDDLGLGEAIEWLAQDFSRRHGVRVHLRIEHIEPAPSDRLSITIYRMVQEALVNVGRHSHASEVHVDLQRQAGDLVLSVHDDGVGLPLPPSPRDNQFGLLGMQERADALGGQLELHNAPGGGACLTVRIPLGRDATIRGTASQAPTTGSPST